MAQHHKRLSLAFISLAILISVATIYAEKKTSLTPVETSLIKEVGLTEQLALEIKGELGNNFEKFPDFPERTEYLDATHPLKSYWPDVTLFIKSDLAKSQNTVRQYVKQLDELGIQFFQSEGYYGYSQNYLVLLKSSDKIEPIIFSATNGINYDFETLDIYNKLAEWDQKLGVKVLAAEFDLLAIQFDRLPPNLLDFANEVVAFCPDALYPEMPTIEALISQLETNRSLVLWWD